jgi:surface protein
MITSNILTSCYYTFYSCSLLEYLPAFDTSAVTDMSYMFAYCYSLKSVPALNMTSVTSNSSNMLYYCYNVESIYLYNIKSTLDISYCYKLGRGTGTGIDGQILDIFNNLAAVTGKTITVPGTKDTSAGVIYLANGEVLTADDIAIATNKGWTVNAQLRS